MRSEKDPRITVFLWDQILKGREREKEGERSGETEGVLADGSALAKGKTRPAAGVCFTVRAWLENNGR